MTVSDIGKKLAAKEISCVDVVREYNKAAETSNKTLNAFITLTPETALDAARIADEKLTHGEKIHALTGVPFALKDNFMTDGIHTTCGSRMLYNYTPYFDAAVWETLKNLNAPLLGKANLDEFAMGVTGETSYYGVTRNPHDETRTAGGSSGGVAAAVAANVALYGIGSDTGGSIRVPAAFCGVYGFKPTYGALSRHGLAAHASSLDQTGIVASNVCDIATVFDAISTRDERDMTSRGSVPVADKITGDIKGKRFGIIRAFTENLPPEIAKAFAETMKTYEQLGVTFVDVEVPYLDYALPAYAVISCAEASSNLGRLDGLRYGYATENYADIDDFMVKSRTEAFGAEVRRRILFGTYALSAGQFDAYFAKATKLALAIKNAFAKVLTDVDCILTPTTPFTAPKIGAQLSLEDSMNIDAFTAPVSLAQLPAISVPCGFDADGLPVGAQIVSRKFADADVLSAAFAFENATSGAFVKIAKGGVSL